MDERFKVLVETSNGKEKYVFEELTPVMMFFKEKYDEDNHVRLTLTCNGGVSSDPVSPAKAGPKVVRHEKSQPRLKLDGVGEPSCPLYDKHVRISGTFDQIGMTRDEVLDVIQKLGASYAGTDIVKSMDIVVLGNNYGPSKEIKIKQWQDDGYKITVLSQFDLKKIFDEFFAGK